MDMTAPAVFEVAPPPRPGPRARPEEAESASFDDHLDQAVQDDIAPAEAKPATESGAAETVSDQGSQQQEAQPQPDALAQPVAIATQTPAPIIIALELAQQPAANPAAQTSDTLAQPATPAAPITPRSDTPAQPQGAAPTSTAPDTTPIFAASEAATSDAATKSAKPETNSGAQAQPIPTAAPIAPVTPQQMQQQLLGGPLPDAAPLTQINAIAPTAPGAPTPAASPTPPTELAAHRDTPRAAAKAAAPVDTATPQAAPTQAQAAIKPAVRTAQTFAAAKDVMPPVAADSSATSAPVQPTAAASAALHSAGAPQTTAIAEHGAARAAPVAAQVGREIVRRFNGGATQFELRLDPPELGRIEVRLDVSRDHKVTAIVTADNPQALSDLSRNARDLEQSLQSAGLNLAENGLSFDLRQSGGEGGSQDSGASAAGTAANTDENPTSSPAPATARLERWRGVRVDVMA